MSPRIKKIKAKAIQPGDVVYSPRTEQMMLILSSGPMEHKNRIKIIWLPMVNNSRLSSCDVDPDLVYHQIVHQKP
jgi:hypothetical protein